MPGWKTTTALALITIGSAAAARAELVNLFCRSTTNPSSRLVCTFDVDNSLVINCFNPVNNITYSENTPLNSTADYIEWHWSTKGVNGTYRLRRQSLELVTSLTAADNILVSDRCELTGDKNEDVLLLPLLGK